MVGSIRVVKLGLAFLRTILLGVAAVSLWTIAETRILLSLHIAKVPH